MAGADTHGLGSHDGGYFCTEKPLGEKDKAGSSEPTSDFSFGAGIAAG